jgi:NADP-dependent 3-hydroxy acid dehydrogenase YdfG
MIVVITGGSRGIGENIIKNLLKKNIKIINISRSECSLGNVKNYKCDISDYEEVKSVFKKIKNFDVLINNSGISKYDNNNINTFNKIIDINLKGLFYCSIEALKKLKKKKIHQ